MKTTALPDASSLLMPSSILDNYNINNNNALDHIQNVNSKTNEPHKSNNNNNRHLKNNNQRFHNNKNKKRNYDYDEKYVTELLNDNVRDDNDDDGDDTDKVNPSKSIDEVIELNDEITDFEREVLRKYMSEMNKVEDDDDDDVMDVNHQIDTLNATDGVNVLLETKCNDLKGNKNDNDDKEDDNDLCNTNIINHDVVQKVMITQTLPESSVADVNSSSQNLHISPHESDSGVMLANSSDALNTPSTSTSITTSTIINNNTTTTSTAAPQSQIINNYINNYRNRNREIRRNFSVWVGITSCVWGILLYLVKSYS